VGIYIFAKIFGDEYNDARVCIYVRTYTYTYLCSVEHERRITLLCGIFRFRKIKERDDRQSSRRAKELETFVFRRFTLEYEFSYGVNFHVQRKYV